jgi:hypothetical protein
VTFFPRRDDTVHSEHNCDYICNVSSHSQEQCTSTADLRDAICFDVSGDNIFQLAHQTQCNDGLDFMASAVWHATTLFLDMGKPDKPIADDLRVLRVFRKSLCSVMGECTKAFSDFKATQDGIWKSIRDKKNSQSMKKLEDAIKELGNSHDLACLINVRDIKDELKILTKLFSEQTSVIDTMVKIYVEIDEQSWNKFQHDRAIRWLEEAKSKIANYKGQVDKMNNDCEELSESVSRR